MSRARFWKQRAALAIVLVASVCLSAGALPHVEGADVICGSIPVSHNQSAHHVDGARAASHDEAQHCFVCHSLRSIHTGFDAFELRTGFQRPERLHAVLVEAVVRRAWTFVPGRAPPA